MTPSEAVDSPLSYSQYSSVWVTSVRLLPSDREKDGEDLMATVLRVQTRLSNNGLAL
jgi:hypothetical protein